MVHCDYCGVDYLFLASISVFSDFQRFLFDIEARQCKFYASMMKSNLFDVQRL